MDKNKICSPVSHIWDYEPANSGSVPWKKRYFCVCHNIHNNCSVPTFLSNVNRVLFRRDYCGRSFNLITFFKQMSRLWIHRRFPCSPFSCPCQYPAWNQYNFTLHISHHSV